MNIVHTETLYNWGGEQNKIINEMIFTRELGHNVMLFCNPDSQISKKAEKLGFNVILCEMNKKNYHKTIPAFCKLIDEKNIDLVITHGSTDSWIGAITRLLKHKNVKFIRERHNMYPIKGFISKFMHKFMFDKILYISQNVYDYLIEIKVDKNKLFYLPDTVDTITLSQTTSTFKQEQNITSSLTVGTFTSLYKKKGVYDFAFAAKKILKDFKDTTIVFGGKISDTVKSEISSIFDKDDNIIFTGFRTDSLNLIKSYDIYVFASHCEGLGTVLLEAMCSNTPIVVYDKEPMNRLIKHQERGLCAVYKDPESLAENIIKFINDTKLRQKCAKNALSYVTEHHDHIKIKNAIKKLLEEI